MKTLLFSFNARYNHANPAIRHLKEAAKDHDVEIMEGGLKDKDFEVLSRLLESGAEAFGFSTYIWNIEKTRKAASLLRKARPEALIFFGGPEAGSDPEEELSLSPQADFIVSGEGERVFPRVLHAFEEALEKGEDPLSYLKDQKLAGVNFRGEPFTQADPVPPSEIPSIRPESVEDLENRIVYVEGQRGCPYRCAYCLSGSGRALRLREPRDVVEEALALSKAGAKLIKFVDRTFNADRHFAKEVLRGIEAGENGKSRYHFEISADILDEELIEIFESARKGLFQLEAGLQSTDEEVLRNVTRSHDTEKILENAARIQAAGNTPVHLDLIVGLPGGTVGTFRRSFDQAVRAFPDMLQIGFLKVLRRTPLREAHGLVYDDAPPYEIVRTSTMSAKEISSLRAFEHVFDALYNSGRYRVLMKQITGEPAPHRFFEGFLESLKNPYEKRSPRREAEAVFDYLKKINAGEELYQAFALDLLQNGAGMPEGIEESLPAGFFFPKEELPDLFSDSRVRAFIESSFKGVKMRSGKYLMRDVAAVRIRKCGGDRQIVLAFREKLCAYPGEDPDCVRKT